LNRKFDEYDWKAENALIDVNKGFGTLATIGFHIGLSGVKLFIYLSRLSICWRSNPDPGPIRIGQFESQPMLGSAKIEVFRVCGELL
jgi:hypothetical protein